MTTRVSTKGQIVLPAEIRELDAVEPGQEFEVERIDRGVYRLKRKERRRNEGLVALLLACPVKGWFSPLDRAETTDDVDVPGLELTYLVDANVLSEPTKPVPDPSVVDWLRANEGRLVVDSIVLGELNIGVLALPRGRRRTKLEQWFEAVVSTLDCLTWDATVSRRWAKLVVDVRRRGETLPLADSMIAATALQHELTVATRNTRDFRKAGVRVVDPFA